VVLEKDGEHQLSRSCENWKVITKSQGGEEYPTNIKIKNGNWIGPILHRNSHLRHLIEGKIEGRT